MLKRYVGGSLKHRVGKIQVSQCGDSHPRCHPAGFNRARALGRLKRHRALTKGPCLRPESHAGGVSIVWGRCGITISDAGVSVSLLAGLFVGLSAFSECVSVYLFACFRVLGWVWKPPGNQLLWRGRTSTIWRPSHSCEPRQQDARPGRSHD